MGRKKTFNNIYIPNNIKTITESIKSEVQRKEIQFPKELGEEHLFDLKLAEQTYKKVGLVKAIVDKHLDFIISPGFYVTSLEPKAALLINKFIKETSFDQLLRQWILESCIKGTGFLEASFDGKEFEFRVINSTSMYIKRDKNGIVEAYNQYVGSFEKFNPNRIIPFTPEEIIPLDLGKVGDDAYGIGLIFPLLKTVDYMASSERDLHMLMQRKANAPIHVKLGSPEEPVSAQDVTGAGQTLEYLNNMHEWATDHRWEFKVVDFGNIGEKFSMVMESDKETLFMAAQIPASIMGQANIPEGLAKSDAETWERRIESLQGAIEKVIEEKIFRRILKANKLDARVEMEWGQPSESKVNQRMTQLTMLLSNMQLSPQLRAMLEIEIANVLQFSEKWIKTLIEPEIVPEIERDKEGNIKQPEIPGEKPQAAENIKELKKNDKWFIHEGINTEDDNLKLSEWINFDYIGYKEQILNYISSDDFSSLRGYNNLDYALGKLNENQINQLRNVLINNFEGNGTIYEIAEDIRKLGFKSVYTINDKGQKRLILDKNTRPMYIARTESTRVASEGILNHYKSQGVEEVRFLASISQRTCPICESLNGTVFTIQEAQGIIPIHVNCRCGWIKVFHESVKGQIK